MLLGKAAPKETVSAAASEKELKGLEKELGASQEALARCREQLDGKKEKQTTVVGLFFL
jgi:hypothetical protein